MANAYLALNRPGEAEKYLLEGNKLIPNNWTITLGLAFLFIDRLQYDSAIQILEQSIGAQGDAREHHQRLGQLYELTGKRETALAHYQQMLPKGEPKGFFDYYYAAVAYCKLGVDEKFAETMQAWEKQFANMSDSLLLMSNLTSTYACCGDNEKSLAWLEKAFQEGYKADCTPDGVWSSFYNPDFHLLRHTPEFKSLVKKYLPEYYKD